MTSPVIDPKDDDVLAVLIRTEQILVRRIDGDVSWCSTEARDVLDESQGASTGID